MDPAMNLSLRLGLMIAVVATLVALAPSRAVAERTVIVVGNSKGKELQAVTAAAGEAVEQAGWKVIAHKLPPERIASVLQCSADADTRCVGKVLDDVGADRLVVLKLVDDTYQKKTARVVYGTILRRGADVLSSGQRYCEECRSDLLADHVRSLITELVKEARRKANPATLVVRSTPAVANVAIDGTLIGPADMELPIDPGVHTLEVTAKGHERYVEEITVNDGQRLEIDVKLIPLGGVGRDGPIGDGGAAKGASGARRPLAPWLVMAGGGLLAAGGVALIAIDEDEVQGGTVVPSWRESEVAGISLALAGGVAVVGGYLWWRTTRKPATVAPSVTLHDGGAEIGLAGRF